jgi:benzylsuccinate CoA-transferase BbsE subunit
MKILELSQGAAAGFAGLLLAQLGAEVTHIDFDSDTVVPSDASQQAFLSRHKQRLRLDLGTRSGTTQMLALVRAADGLVEDLGPGGLGRLRLSPRRLRRINKTFMIASVAPFGQTGPYADWQASELVVQSMAGMVHPTGWDGEAPLKLAGSMAAYIAGLHAAMAMCAGVYGVSAETEPGVQVDISAQETGLLHWSRHIGQWAYNGTGLRRDRRTFDGQGVPSTAMAADGWLCLAVRNARWDSVAGLLGLEAFLADEWQTPRTRVERWSDIAPSFATAIRSRSRAEWFTAAAERGLIVAPVQDLHEVLDSEQYTARGYFESVDVDGQTLDCPGLPFTWNG